jgi:SAM-dependent methyltransferase
VDFASRKQLVRPLAILAGPRTRLFLTSATLLFVELLFIRWIPANVVYVGYFTNFLLMASFLGIGLGILLGRIESRVRVSPFPLLLFGTVVLVLSNQLNIHFDPGDQFFHGLHPDTSADPDFAILPLLMLLVVGMMASLAMPLGGLLRALPPLKAYAIDILGSLAGIAAFGLMSAFALEPTAWFTLTAVLLALLALGRGITIWSSVPSAAMLGVLVVVFGSAGPDAWSPYYRIRAGENDGRVANLHRGSSDLPVHIQVNGVPHQSMAEANVIAGNLVHGQIYRWFPQRIFERVLIIGAGTGNDTALALRRGSSHIDAVEIDPVIADIGRRFHPDRPYDDPRVTVTIDDGRAFLQRSTDRYDLIVFALTDSLTLVTSTANLRLESFLFTEEAFAAARDHLAEDGVFAMSNHYREPWLVTKLDGMATRVFGETPLLRTDATASAVIATGPGVVTAQEQGMVGDEVDGLDALGPTDGGTSTVPTDDWPFLYLRNPGIPPYYYAALAALLGFAVVAVGAASRVTGMPLRRGFSPHFFMLGMAFLLLETRSLVSFSLLFGTTWSVNALVFFAILVSVLVSIGISARFPVRRSGPLYVALFGALALAWLLPPQALLLDPPVLRYAVGGALAFAPIVFANLVFASSFRDTEAADMAFASNLLGAMVGGALEYLALVTGYRALLFLVAGLYLLAYLAASRWRFLADRHLARSRGALPELAASD